MALAKHMSLSLTRYCTTFDNSVHEINVTDPLRQQISPIRSSPAPRASRPVIGHLMHCPTLQDSLGHTRHRLLLRRLDHRCFLCDSLRRLWLHSVRRN